MNLEPAFFVVTQLEDAHKCFSVLSCRKHESVRIQLRVLVEVCLTRGVSNYEILACLQLLWKVVFDESQQQEVLSRQAELVGQRTIWVQSKYVVHSF